jgi:hypothetical protein
MHVTEGAHMWRFCHVRQAGSPECLDCVQNLYVSASSIPVSRTPAISAKAATPRSSVALGASPGPARGSAPAPAPASRAALPMPAFGFQAPAPQAGNMPFASQGVFGAGPSAPQPFQTMLAGQPVAQAVQAVAQVRQSSKDSGVYVNFEDAESLGTS